MKDSNRTVKIVMAIIVFLCCAFCSPFAVRNVYAAEIVVTGTCGTGLTWELDDEGTLTISGSGDMDNYNITMEDPPWYSLGYSSSIKKVQIDDGVTSIGNCAFTHCSNLTSVVIPDSIKIIGRLAFGECGSLTSIEIPDGVTCIRKLAFNNCVHLKSLIIPDSVSCLEESIVSGCTRLTDIVIPEGALGTEIPDNFFSGCISLSSFTIPEKISSIGSGAFQGCSSLTSIYIPEGVTNIGHNAFSQCTGLTSISIPESVTEISSSVFEECNNLKTVKLPENLTGMGQDAFKGCSSLENINIPASLKYIPSRLFYGCNSLSLTSPVIPEGVTHIGSEPFYGCHIQSLVIPDSVTELDYHAFNYFEGDIVIKCDPPSNKTDALSNVNGFIYYSCLNELWDETERNLWGSSSKWKKLHSFDQQIIDEKYLKAKAACEAPAEYYYSCECGESSEGTEFEKSFTEGQALGHKWNSPYTIDKPATCTEDGYKSIHCSACDAIREGTGQVVPATGHNYTAWNIVIEPTADYEGLQGHYCVNCGDIETEVIPKLPPSDTPTDTPTDTPSDTPTDTPADTPTDTPSDTPTDTPTDTPSDTPEQPAVDPVNQTGADGTALGAGASVEAAEAAIAGMTTDNDLPGAVFGKLQLRSKKQTNTSISLSWKKIPDAASYVIYGNKCGKKNKLQRLAVSTGKSKTFKKVLGKKVKKGTYYKFMVVALDKNNNVVSSSKIVHVATKGGKVGNVGKVTTKARKNKVVIKKGKTFKLKGKQTPAVKRLKVKKHRAVKYESSDPKIATVTKKGVIKGKKKGTCYIYAYAQNGVFAKIKVTVKQNTKLTKPAKPQNVHLGDVLLQNYFFARCKLDIANIIAK